MVGFKEIQEEEERASTAKHSVKPGPGEGTGWDYVITSINVTCISSGAPNERFLEVCLI